MLKFGLRRVQPKLNYANVMSTIAVFLVLGGGAAYAHGLIATKDIQKQAVTSAKLAAKSVKKGKIAPAAVKSGKIVDGAVNASKLGQFIIRTEEITIGSGSQDGAGAACAPGELLIGGGAHWPSFASNLQIVHSLPQLDENRWFARGANHEGNDGTFRIVAYCLQ